MKVQSVGVLVAITTAFISMIGAAQAQRLRAFAEPNYLGTEQLFRDPQPNLQVARPTKIASVRVVTARWLICAGTSYSGDCAWVSRDVASLPQLGFTDTPGSLKPERIPVLLRQWGGRRAAPRTELALFEKPGYDGDWIALKDSVPDFNAAHLKSPGSIVLGDGAWRLCTGIDYSGRCLITTGSAWDLSEIFPGRILSAKRLH